MNLYERNQKQKVFFNEKIDSYDDSHSTYMETKKTLADNLDKDAKKILEEVCASKNASIQSKIALGMMYLAEKNFEKGIPYFCESIYNLNFHAPSVNLVILHIINVIFSITWFTWYNI